MLKNPFHKTYFSQKNPNIMCLLKVPSTSSLPAKLKKLNPNKPGDQQETDILISITKPFTINCKYNPQPNTKQNIAFITNITTNTTT